LVVSKKQETYPP